VSAFDQGYLVKNPAASELFDFDFTDMVPAAATLSTPTATQISKANKVVGSSNLTIASANVSGKIVQARISGGTDGEDYLIRATAVDSVLGNTVVIEIVLQVRTLPFER